MKLELCNWAIWQSIWPIERKGLLFVRSDVGWEENNVEIRGNALFIYPQYDTQCVIGRGYLLEYAQSQLQIFTPQVSLKSHRIRINCLQLLVKTIYTIVYS